MTDPTQYQVKLICAVMFAPKIDIDNIITSLENAFGAVDDKSAVIDFTHTDYYTPEMGPNLKKMLVSFDSPFNAENLWLAKHTTIDIEKIFSKNGKRLVNLDPGYIESSKLVLASTKNFSHRIYLNRGIWAELTLLYEDKNFQKLPWTYPDYLSDEFINFLRRIRQNL